MGHLTPFTKLRSAPWGGTKAGVSQLDNVAFTHHPLVCLGHPSYEKRSGRIRAVCLLLASVDPCGKAGRLQRLLMRIRLTLPHASFTELQREQPQSHKVILIGACPFFSPYLVCVNACCVCVCVSACCTTPSFWTLDEAALLGSKN